MKAIKFLFRSIAQVAQQNNWCILFFKFRSIYDDMRAIGYIMIYDQVLKIFKQTYFSDPRNIQTSFETFDNNVSIISMMNAFVNSITVST